ncbi:class I SAM-dependent methyltransferase [Foetidibacter luteolus]|uniref:class I SAM-dependent methyltransferase n=1 Tax=Foetidibacter luteolus TaxID=2608880 RepID=UPI00129A9B5A|nr:class I SAM-dependent methyltransferase [Foetidibacter luteolus]
MNFTSHNILLNNGTQTLGNSQELLSHSGLWTSIEKTIDLFFPKSIEARAKMRVADLGCLEGGYTVEFARLGFQSLGIEARKENLSKCNYVKSNLSLPNLNFVQDDVRNLPDYGKFDIVLCYGLLYHLNDPVNFINIMSNCTNKLLLLNTHFSPEQDIRYNLGLLNNYLIAPLQKRTGLFEHQKNFRLTSMLKNEGYRGRWYKEWNKKEKTEKVEKLLWASYNNNRSFWLCKKDLTNALHNAGFHSVFEQFNYTGGQIPENYSHFLNRSMFVAVKHT